MAMGTSDQESFSNLLSKICYNGERLATTIPVGNLVDLDCDPAKVTLWVDRIDASSRYDMQHAVALCHSFITASHEIGQRCCLIFCHSVRAEGMPQGYILLLESKAVSFPNQFENTYKNSSWLASMFSSNYLPLWTRLPEQPLQTKIWPSYLFLRTLVVLLLLFIAFLLATPFLTAQSQTSSWPEDGYIRYPTPNSHGPKRQLQLFYHNATEWARNNPHQNGEWRMRMDDQALIPSALWDKDEDFYQAWYYARYPHMREIIQQRKYMRPSWLGSLDTLVPWDKEFHFNHCIIAFRRYWKAKETGKHVCPRDIDYNHVQHCLNWLDGMLFSPGGYNVSMGTTGTHMAWQTKICF